MESIKELIASCGLNCVTCDARREKKCHIVMSVQSGNV